MPATSAGPPRRQAGERLRSALEAITQALAAPGFSLERLRRLVIRYGALAHDQALQVDEMSAALTRTVDRALDSVPSIRQAEVLASVQWWAVHGYHRAD